MIPPQVGLSLRTKKKRPKKPMKKKIKEANEKKDERKREKGNATILFPHLCFKVAP